MRCERKRNREIPANPARTILVTEMPAGGLEVLAAGGGGSALVRRGDRALRHGMGVAFADPLACERGWSGAWIRLRSPGPSFRVFPDCRAEHRPNRRSARQGLPVCFSGMAEPPADRRHGHPGIRASPFPPSPAGACRHIFRCRHRPCPEQYALLQASVQLAGNGLGVFIGSRRPDAGPTSGRRLFSG